MTLGTPHSNGIDVHPRTLDRFVAINANTDFPGRNALLRTRDLVELHHAAIDQVVLHREVGRGERLVDDVTDAAIVIRKRLVLNAVAFLDDLGLQFARAAIEMSKDALHGTIGWRDIHRSGHVGSKRRS
ncbi:MAG: hypothetical protein ABI724_03985 [Betaproteobacteria bacterium]